MVSAVQDATSGLHQMPEAPKSASHTVSHSACTKVIDPHAQPEERQGDIPQGRIWLPSITYLWYAQLLTLGMTSLGSSIKVANPWQLMISAQERFGREVKRLCTTEV